jgi:hypothetical protein
MQRLPSSRTFVSCHVAKPAAYRAKLPKARTLRAAVEEPRLLSARERLYAEMRVWAFQLEADTRFSFLNSGPGGFLTGLEGFAVNLEDLSRLLWCDELNREPYQNGRPAAHRPPAVV